MASISKILRSWRHNRFLDNTADVVVLLKARAADRRIMNNYPALEAGHSWQESGIICDTINELCAIYRFSRYSVYVAEMRREVERAQDRTMGIETTFSL